MHPKELSILDYTYVLPDTRIARYPLAARDQSKLLVYDAGNIQEATYQQLADFIPEKSLLIYNNTKVVAARLIFQKSTGTNIELFCLEPADPDSNTALAMTQHQKVAWKCLVGGARKWKSETLLLQIPNGDDVLQLYAKKIAQQNDAYIIELSWTPEDLSFAEVLHKAGQIPLPPYLKRTAEESDKDRYQTVYAATKGSVAAPTAGLHFTDEVFNTLRQKNIAQAFVTLHVGAGTFKPVKADRMWAHEMHAEWMDVSLEFIESLLQQITHPVICVGTTSLRTVESLYWLGVKIIAQPHLQKEDIQLSQWEVYDLKDDAITVQEALQALTYWMQQHQLNRLITKTQIIIAPGYRFKIIHALITNFHQPQSTLLLLVAALVGNNWSAIYQYALNNDFRFLSYGDGSLLWVTDPENKK